MVKASKSVSSSAASSMAADPRFKVLTASVKRLRFRVYDVPGYGAEYVHNAAERAMKDFSFVGSYLTSVCKESEPDNRRDVMVFIAQNYGKKIAARKTL